VEETQALAPHPEAPGGQSPEELADYQIEMIRQEAHTLWLIRIANGTPGDARHDWEEAERHYYSNN